MARITGEKPAVNPQPEIEIVGRDKDLIPATPIDRSGKPVHYSALQHLREALFPRRIERPDTDRYVSGTDGVPVAQIPDEHPRGSRWHALDPTEKQYAWMRYERSRAYAPNAVPEVGADGLTPAKLLAVTPSVTTFESGLDAGPPRIKAPHTSGAVLATSLVGTSDFATGFFGGRGDVSPGVSRFSMGTTDARGQTQPGFALKAFGDGANPSGNGLFYVKPDPVSHPDTFFTEGGREPMMNLIGTPESFLLRAIPENAFEAVAHPGHRHLDQLTGYDASGTAHPGETPAAQLVPSEKLSMAKLARNPTAESAKYEALRMRRFRDIDCRFGITDLALTEVALHDPGRRIRSADALLLRVPDAKGEMREIRAFPRTREGTDTVVCDLHVDLEDQWAIRGHLDPRLELQRRIQPGDTLYTVNLSWPSGKTVEGAAEVRADSEIVLGYAGDRELAFQHTRLDSERQLSRARKWLWQRTAGETGKCAALESAGKCPVQH